MFLLQPILHFIPQRLVVGQSSWLRTPGTTVGLGLGIPSPIDTVAHAAITADLAADRRRTTIQLRRDRTNREPCDEHRLDLTPFFKRQPRRRRGKSWLHTTRFTQPPLRHARRHADSRARLDERLRNRHLLPEPPLDIARMSRPRHTHSSKLRVLH